MEVSKMNNYKNKATWKFASHISCDQDLYNLLLLWIKDNIDRKEDKDFGTMFINDFLDLMTALITEQRLSPHGVTHKGKQYISAYIKMVYDMNTTTKEDIDPVDIKEWLHSHIES